VVRRHELGSRECWLLPGIGPLTMLRLIREFPASKTNTHRLFPWHTAFGTMFFVALRTQSPSKQIVSNQRFSKGVALETA